MRFLGGSARIAVAGALLAAAPAWAALLSKSFQFKPDTDLEISSPVEGGLRLDKVHFYLPSTTGEVSVRGGTVRADVAVSNLGDHAQMFGIAIALLDDQGRLVGAANGGPKMLPLRPSRQGTYPLVFFHVNGEAYKATTFKITVETKP